MDESLNTADKWSARHLSHPPDYQPRLQGLNGHHPPTLAVVSSKVRPAVVHHAEGVEGCAPVAERTTRRLLEVPCAVGCDFGEVDLDVLVPVLAVVLMCCT